MIAGLACAFVIGKALPSTMDAISAIIEPLCASSDPAGSTLDTVEPIASHALPNVPGKRVTIVRVFYGPGGFTRAHRHAGSVTAYVTKGEIRSQLAGGAVEIFKVGQSFFEPPGAVHLVSANASNTEPAELIAVFVADEGAQLTTFVEVAAIIVGWARRTSRRAHHLDPDVARRWWARARFAHPTQSQTGFSMTFNPSRGFGIGHICQSGL